MTKKVEEARVAAAAEETERNAVARVDNANKKAAEATAVSPQQQQSSTGSPSSARHPRF